MQSGLIAVAPHAPRLGIEERVPAVQRALLDGTPPGDWLARHKITIAGWTDASFAASSARHDQLPMGFNDRIPKGFLSCGEGGSSGRHHFSIASQVKEAARCWLVSRYF